MTQRKTGSLRRFRYPMLLALALALIALLLAWILGSRLGASQDDSIRVGILHSLSGTMAISERSVVAATQLAIDSLNETGGVLGRQVQVIIRDGASDWPTFAREAEALISEDRVDVVFGCWTSASRKTVRPVFERHDHLLFYPVQYEGLEHSPNIVYTGAAPNQQIIPAVKWALDNLGPRIFLVGSDYVFPHSAHAIMKDQIRALHGTLVGEHYILLGSTAVDAAVQAIAQTRPDAILNTLNGDSNVAFFRALHARGITPQDIPTISFSIAEAELQAMGSRNFAGDYAAWNYFQSLSNPENRRFIQAYKDRHGSDAVVTDPMEAAWIGVHLWARAAEAAGSTAPRAVRQMLPDVSLRAPEGPVSIDPDNQHLWKSVRIGRIRADGQFDVVWSTRKPIRPQPYPSYRSRQEWTEFLEALNQRWNGQWANPTTTPSPSWTSP